MARQVLARHGQLKREDLKMTATTVVEKQNRSDISNVSNDGASVIEVPYVARVKIVGTRRVVVG
jgi:hypothetical protein